MKYLILVLLPVIISLLLTHFISGWHNTSSSVETFAICFFLIGGIEFVGFVAILRLRTDS
jgi:hypothetical protein